MREGANDMNAHSTTLDGIFASRNESGEKTNRLASTYSMQLRVSSCRSGKDGGRGVCRENGDNENNQKKKTSRRGLTTDVFLSSSKVISVLLSDDEDISNYHIVVEYRSLTSSEEVTG